MKISGRYRGGLYAGVAACGFLVLIGSINIPASLWQSAQKDEWSRRVELEKEQLKAQSDIEKEQLKLQRQRADIASENEVEPTRPHLLIMGYVDNPKKFPRIDERAFTNANQIYLVTDTNGKCIGIGQNQKFRWRHAPTNENVCRHHQGENQ
jgi:hypothetical protein